MTRSATEMRPARAAVSHGPSTVRIEEVGVPAPGPGEALVAMRACGICGSDLLDWYVEQKAPAVLGHEPIGVVEEVGDPAPAGIKPGARVFAHHHVPCLVCDVCRRGHETRCETFRSTRLVPGGFATRFLVPAANARADLLVLPPGLDDLTATLIEPLACCVHGQRLAALDADTRLLVVGVGQMGLLHVQAALAAGCRNVIATDPMPARRTIASELGAIAVEPEVAAVAAAVDGRPTVAIVCTGAESAISLAFDVVDDGGVVQLFAPTEPDQELRLNGAEIFFRELTVQGSYSAGPADTRLALDLLASGRVTADRIVTHRYALDDVEEALAVARSEESIKVVVLGAETGATSPGSGSEDEVPR